MKYYCPEKIRRFRSSDLPCFVPEYECGRNRCNVIQTFDLESDASYQKKQDFMKAVGFA